MRAKIFRAVTAQLTVAVLVWSLVVQAGVVQSVNGQKIEKNVVEPAPTEPSLEEVKNTMGRSAVEFEENRGQFDKQVRYMARTGGSTMFLTATEAVYVLPVPEERKPKLDPEERGFDNPMREFKQRKPSRAVALRMQIVGANPNSHFTGEDQTEHQTNYFRGSDPDGWRTEIPNYRRIRYDNVYEGVGLVWHGREGGGTQYDFVVEPNADPNQVSLRFEGADRLETDTNGNLLIHTEAGVLKQTKPFTYQETNAMRSEVESGFVVEGNTVRFAVADYDRSKPLTIDPVNLSNLAYSTFVGDGEPTAIATDATGNVYLAGTTLSPSFPTVAGSFDTSSNGEADAFVAKLNVNGTGLIYSTFLGGSGFDMADCLAVDSTGNAYVAGLVHSGDFPVTSEAFDTSHNGSLDVFVTKIGASGSRLTYSTYLGGSYEDYGTGIAIDSSGRAYVSVYTAPGTTVFPTTAGAFDKTPNGGSDAALAILDPTGFSLVYSTFIGGGQSDAAQGVAVDFNGNAFITGYTRYSSTINYPTTATAFDSTPNGSYDVFLIKINPNLTGSASLVYSTLLGGGSDDIGTDVDVDSQGNAYLVGYSSDTANDYPTTPGAFDRVPMGRDIVVSKINPNLSGSSSLVYSTFIGGALFDSSGGIVVDSAGNAFITGLSDRDNNGYPTVAFPVTAGAFDTTHNGFGDAFVTKINVTGSALAYSTYIGSGGEDMARDICLDSAGNVFIAGQSYYFSSGSPFPTTSGVFQEQPVNGDIFVTKLGDFSISGRILSLSGKPMSGILVTMSGSSSATTSTASDGSFYFGDTILGGNYVVTTAAIGFSFSPPSFTINPLNSNQEFMFIGQPTN